VGCVSADNFSSRSSANLPGKVSGGRTSTQGWWESLRAPTSASETASEEIAECSVRRSLLMSRPRLAALGRAWKGPGTMLVLRRAQGAAPGGFAIASGLDVAIFHSESACGSRQRLRAGVGREHNAVPEIGKLGKL
jgi:hypothetical protein